MSKTAFRLIEVGILVGKYEFYHVFSYPYVLSMRSYDSRINGYQKLSVEDFLISDLPHHIARFLGIPNVDLVKCHYVSSFFGDARNPVPVSHGDSRVESWARPFIFDIASYFITNYGK